jgi:hypothetical protein
MEAAIETGWAALDSPASDPAKLEEDLPKAKVDVKGWISLAVVCVGLVGGAVWAIAHEFATVNQRIGNVDAHISRVETAVRIVGAKQGGDTQTLIDEALKVTVANAKSDPDGAKVTLAIANRWITQQSEAHIPAPQESFSSAIEQYQALVKIPALSETAHEGMLKLAEYKSGVVPSPENLPNVFAGSMERRGRFTYLYDALISGAGGLYNDPQGAAIDYFVMRNVVFRNAVIVYHGGPVVMDHVVFINCRFITPNTPQGNQLLEIAIKEKAASATIG